ncbi:hypothetical protein GCM10009733_092710 [Nonomuraea maheshkhaliensis]|uniref:Chromosome partition protein Smc n=1 Tax=Nonomuraea maheshkhaliensis TaxID=419590 RepID=A0ABN2H4V1_9ACTN
MLDCEERHLRLETRLKALEDATVSGVPGQSIATRFWTHYGRISIVAQNINEKIEREVGTLRTEMKAGFAAVEQRFEQVDQRFEQVDQRFEQVDQRFEQVDQRFEQVDQRFEQVDERLGKLDHRVSLLGTEINMLRSTAHEMSDGIAKINKDSARRDLRIDKIEKQLATHDERFNSIEALLIRIDAKLTGDQPN